VVGPVSLDPLINTGGNGDNFANELIYQPLVRPDPFGSDALVPGIADRWTISPNGLEYSFHIRDNARWANGEPVTADDVKFSLDRFGNPKLNQFLPSMAIGYKATQVIDSHNVVVHLTQPVSAMLYNIGFWVGFIYPKKPVEQQGKAFFNKPIGSGPFMVENWTPGSSITFVRNPYYWETGKPYLDEVKYLYATDDNSRMLALRSGQVQAVDGVPFEQVDTFRSNPKVYLQFTKTPYFEDVSLNHRKPYFTDLNVRQALQYAIDKESINKEIFAGTGTIPNSCLPQLKYDGTNQQVQPYAYDLAKAKQLMSKSSYPSGFETTLQYPAGFAYYSKLALVLQSEWDQIGVNVRLIEEDQGTMTNKFWAEDYEMIFPFAQYTSDEAVPDEYGYLMFDPHGTDGFETHWHDPAIWTMFQQFAKGSEATRQQLWPQIQKAMLIASPTINIMDLPFIQAYANNVRNPWVNVLGASRLEHTWLA